jgi:predicted MFS family arabinose efflux permease
MLSYSIAGQATLPFVPLYAQQLGLGPRAIGLLLSLPGLGAVLASLVASAWLSRFGARRLLLGASIAAFGSLIAVWLWRSVGVFAVFMPLFWTVQPLVAVGVQVLVVTRGAAVGQDRAVGMHSVYMSFGASLGPLLGAAAVAATGRIETVFPAAAAMGAVSALIAARASDSPSREPVSGLPLRTSLRGASAATHVAIAAVLVAEFCYTAWGVFFPLALKGAGVNPGVIGVVFAVYGLAISLGRATMAWSVSRVGRLGTLIAAFGCMAAGLWFSTTPGARPLPYVAAVLLGLGGLTFPVTIVLVSVAAPAGALGGLLAARFLAITIGQTAGPLVAGLVAGVGVTAVLGGVAGAASVTALLLVEIRRRMGDTFLDTPKSPVLR